MAIKLIVGLGNHGKEYQEHRHNVGYWFVNSIATQNFNVEKKFYAQTYTYKKVKLLKAATYMNNSGLSVQAVVNFFKISQEEILVVHDDLDLDAGVIKLKKSGGHGGHNGLKDIIKAIGSKEFYRLRIGISRPENSAFVSDFVLHKPTKNELEKINIAIDKGRNILDTIISGDFTKAMQELHTQN